MATMKLPNHQNNRFEKAAEIITWVIIILVLIFISFLPSSIVNKDSVYILAGAIIAFALFYYYVIYKLMTRTKRLYLKNIADIIFIGILIHLTKDFGVYFFALYFLPIVAAALYLELISALLIATVAAAFIALEIILQSQGLLPGGSEFYLGAWQIGIILVITLFCRFLALQLKSERIAKEEQLAKVEALKDEAKLEKEFITLTSHQLNTPLSIIRGYSSMLECGDLGKTAPNQKEAITEIYKNSVSMANLVAELLNISHIQSQTFRLQTERTQIGDLIEKVYKNFQKAAEQKKLDFKYIKPTKQLPEIYLDKIEIEEVLKNLIENAIIYTSKGKVSIFAEQKDNNIVVKIQDTGVGIPAQDKEKIFQPFFRGQSILEIRKRGTGLGLYICKLLVEKHHGKIWAQSSPAGSTFAFSLPIA
ncbi:MAG: hypothetical protein COX39_02155 [Candidatus Nealsonbacteria bacterium CG23_combo_of_CG06-09_8_20_14_all_40_13]|uniref:histidine kinase n=1 Tax=Candidatus Nealsonbacteria bacterium CG23_combo_of_CG06-09_8_20_14_all_40_13 TaxID=1974724 RepID=A0A2G9YR06_9BACT|nr:MAG: hypothetical protein COX39_02155 [Candidatus Nealsonbacteria bacterium CG23_combo_of_CG06-09_8_20_14_all_40_13]